MTTTSSAHSLERALYIDEEHFERERERLIFRGWLYAGHESQLGSECYMTYEVGDESVIITRDADGALHAMFNVCRHRGARICNEPAGRARRLVCPYHQWTYDLQGKLQRATRMDDDFDVADYPLTPVHVDSWCGFIFVNLFADDPPPLADVVGGELVTSLDRFKLDEAKVAATEVYEVAANWKLVMENSKECYHCAGSHPELCRTFSLPDYFASAGKEETQNTFFLREGMRTFTATGDYACKKLLMDAPPAEGETGPYVTAYVPMFTTIGSFADYALCFSLLPVSTGHTRVRFDWLVSRDAEEGRDYDVDELKYLWDVTNRQDWPLCELAHRGVLSRTYRPGPHSLVGEPGISAFLDDYVGAMEISPTDC